MDDPRRILKRPLVTEKGTWMQEVNNQFVFEVNRDANKIQIKKTVESLFPDVKVTRVNTMRRKGKQRRTFGRFHLTHELKRAIVTLRDGDNIDFF